MGLTTRYFSTSSAGDGDGTSWANRAAYLDGSGYLSTIITGFDFSSNSLLCLIGPGEYIFGQGVQSSIFTSTIPSLSNQCLNVGVDSNGDFFRFKQPWDSAAPWDLDLPLLNLGSAYYINCNFISWIWLNITGSRNGYIAQYYELLQNVLVENTGSGTSGYAITHSTYKIPVNCCFRCTGSYSSVVVGGSAFYNCRIEGSGVGIGSGNRKGIYTTAPSSPMVKCTICKVNGVAFSMEATSSGRQIDIINSTFADCGSDGIYISNSVAATAEQHFVGNVIVGMGGYGINIQNSMPVIINRNRMRDNTSGNVAGLVNMPDSMNDFSINSGSTSAIRNANEFVDYAGGDYRLKSESHLWRTDIGAGDEHDFQRFIQRLRT